MTVDIASQSDAQITHAIILTDSMNLLQKAESRMGCPDWHTAMHSLRIQRLLWIYCPGHAGISGNEQADRLASTADNNCIWYAALQGRSAPRLEELSEHGQARESQYLSPQGKRSGERKRPTVHPPRSIKRSVFHQANIGTVLRATLGKLLTDGAERVWACRVIPVT